MTREEIDKRIDELYERIDNLEDTEENKEEINKLRDEIAELDNEEADPVEWLFDVTIRGFARVTAETQKEAEAKLYDALKNHPEIAVQSIEIEEH